MIQLFFFYRDYWSTRWPFHNDSLSKIISGRRFELLLKYLHLNDNMKMAPKGSPSYDKLHKIRPLLDSLIMSFKTHYTPTKCLSIDESIVGFKGRLFFVQYLPKKPTKWGIKTSDASNGYIWNLNVYTGLLVIHL